MVVIFAFLAATFFFVENRENFLLSIDRNMVFPQILSYTITLQSMVIEICELPPASSAAITFRGVADWKMGTTPQKQIFYKFCTICQDLRKFFSLHPNVQQQNITRKHQ